MKKNTGRNSSKRKNVDPLFFFEVMVLADFCLNQLSTLKEIVKSTKDKSLKKQVDDIEDRLATLYSTSGKKYFSTLEPEKASAKRSRRKNRNRDKLK